jgi:transcription elongation factor GreB
MSKAFTKEAESEPAPVVTPRLELPPGARSYLTPAGAARLRAELDALLAAGHEEPEAARRIHFLGAHLEAGEVIDPRAQERDRVRFGATVVVRDEDDREHRYRIVGVPEAAPDRGLVSWLSPIARALLGASVGDVVTVRTPAGNHELEVESIGYEE